MVRGLERFAFRDAAKVITISNAFSRQLIAAGVQQEVRADLRRRLPSLELGAPRASQPRGERRS
ncbi:MAG: hypothetical protein U0R26_10610 [Solirubrobacterales bacterium]